MSIIPSGIFKKLKPLLKNPMLIFIYGIVAKWYIAIFVTVIVVTFWIFTGLKDTGLLSAAEDTIFKAFKDTKSVARYCVPKIIHFSDFWDCLQNPPEYEPTNEEKALEDSLNNIAHPGGYGGSNQDPYADYSGK